MAEIEALKEKVEELGGEGERHRVEGGRERTRREGLEKELETLEGVLREKEALLGKMGYEVAGLKKEISEM